MKKRDKNVEFLTKYYFTTSTVLSSVAAGATTTILSNDLGKGIIVAGVTLVASGSLSAMLKNIKSDTQAYISNEVENTLALSPVDCSYEELKPGDSIDATDEIIEAKLVRI